MGYMGIEHTPLFGLVRALEQVRDPRTVGWLYSGNPVPIHLILVLYVYFVKYRGPEWMKDRKPFTLVGVMRLYNISMVALNFGFMVFFFKNTYLRGNYSWLCTGIDYRPTEQSMTVLNACWWYLHVRMAEFLDTVFFVLRKKNSQVSKLHVIHHCIVVWNGWVGLTFGAEGQIMICICINCLVHVVMYSYYFLSSFGPALQPYLWWKRYLTQMQIAQLAFFVVYAIVPMVYDCNYPRVMLWIGFVQALLLLTLFCNFYLHAYRGSRRSQYAPIKKHVE
ncbi:very long chain fatty acid elongase 4-like [Dermacentor variabilis]|uniref:very long chain fatty acid elongase 4-like n=1 Tax=Dermacentor variabilis TaxID=34621 RepID=UPI003F5B97D8